MSDTVNEMVRRPRTISGQEHKTKTYIETEMAHAGLQDSLVRF